MKILIATPLYPPDIAVPAHYAYELAKRLSLTDEVTVVTYGRLPEEISGVKTIAVDNRAMLLTRLFKCTLALKNATRDADVIYVQNGASVELPAVIVQTLTRKKMFIHFIDTGAHERASKNILLHILERIAKQHSKAVVSDTPLPRPEILPLEPKPEAELSLYETSWMTHLQMLKSLFIS